MHNSTVVLSNPWASATARLAVAGLAPPIHLKDAHQILLAATQKKLSTDELTTFAQRLRVVYPPDVPQFNQWFLLIGKLLNCSPQEAQLHMPHCEPIVVESNDQPPPWTYTKTPGRPSISPTTNPE